MLNVGDKVPAATLMKREEDGSITNIEITQLLAGRKVALIGMPGAFTGTCTADHLPSLMNSMPALQAKGVDEVVVFTVNDPFVVQKWGEVTGAAEAGITLLADPASDLTKAMGAAFSAPPVGFVDRSQRFASIVEDGTVRVLNIEDGPGTCSMTGGDALVEAL